MVAYDCLGASPVLGVRFIPCRPIGETCADLSFLPTSLLRLSLPLKPHQRLPILQHRHRRHLIRHGRSELFQESIRVRADQVPERVGVFECLERCHSMGEDGAVFAMGE